VLPEQSSLSRPRGWFAIPVWLDQMNISISKRLAGSGDVRVYHTAMESPPTSSDLTIE
jgi:hypothetical protein